MIALKSYFGGAFLNASAMMALYCSSVTGGPSSGPSSAARSDKVSVHFPDYFSDYFKTRIAVTFETVITRIEMLANVMRYGFSFRNDRTYRTVMPRYEMHNQYFSRRGWPYHTLEHRNLRSPGN
jgi:hypothetical protein